MGKVADTRERQHGPLDNFLGADARKGIAEQIKINEHIHATWVDVAFPEDDQPEEHGNLYVYPIDDTKFSLQLCYLTYSDTTTESAVAYSIQFFPSFFDQFPEEALAGNTYFSTKKTAVLQFSIEGSSATLLNELRLAEPRDAFTGLLLRSRQAAGLLDAALRHISKPVTVAEVPACRFLAYDSEREKILEACTIIERNDGRPPTIRELSRMVAMNECYLKKGFKALTGKTIHEYQQEIRINKAKDMLKVRGISVTDVALTLGYSSISHFSTAFKRVTGLKPCELLS
ncbi:helix-turn-helix domain-containing protein [Flavipsychrobacter stenotrophus]|uniref:helix-turn-helix domain-containing protein n=1 Tax=Flavipsychrobacter stenotrophus TaxID=2077091 RepID=UPI001F0C1FC9|nr:AraC family transcriptional regulator [Flavipsychrobacter stenotrophus]